MEPVIKLGDVGKIQSSSKYNNKYLFLTSLSQLQLLRSCDYIKTMC